MDACPPINIPSTNTAPQPRPPPQQPTPPHLLPKLLPTPLPLLPIRHLRQHEVPRLLLLPQRLLIIAATHIQPLRPRPRRGLVPDQIRVLERVHRRILLVVVRGGGLGPIRSIGFLDDVGRRLGRKHGRRERDALLFRVRHGRAPVRDVVVLARLVAARDARPFGDVEFVVLDLAQAAGADSSVEAGRVPSAGQAGVGGEGDASRVGWSRGMVGGDFGGVGGCAGPDG